MLRSTRNARPSPSNAVAQAETARPTSLVALEIAGKVRRQLRLFLEAAGITDLKQLEGRSRSEVLLVPGVHVVSLSTIETVMREAGLAPLDKGEPRKAGRKPKRQRDSAPAGPQ
jgi:hypothetical protein